MHEKRQADAQNLAQLEGAKEPETGKHFFFSLRKFWF
jgi:hypothetical protein